MMIIQVQNYFFTTVLHSTQHIYFNSIKLWTPVLTVLIYFWGMSWVIQICKFHTTTEYTEVIMNLASYRRWNPFPMYGSPVCILGGEGVGSTMQVIQRKRNLEQSVGSECHNYGILPVLIYTTPLLLAFWVCFPKKMQKEITYYHFLHKFSFSKCLHYFVPDLWACIF